MTNKKIDLYSIKNAEILKKHYQYVIVGKVLESINNLKITEIVIQIHNNDKYELICLGNFINDSSLVPKISVQSVCEILNLDSPQKTLKHLC